MDRADIYVTIDGRVWELMPQTETGSKYVGVPVRGRLRLSDEEAKVICRQARETGLRVRGDPT